MATTDNRLRLSITASIKSDDAAPDSRAALTVAVVKAADALAATDLRSHVTNYATSIVIDGIKVDVTLALDEPSDW